MNLLKHFYFAKNFAFDAKRISVFLVFYVIALLVFGALALSFLVAVGSSLSLLARGALFDGIAQSLQHLVSVGLVFLLAFLLLAIIFYLAYLWLFAGIVHSAASVLKHERRPLSTCLSEGLKRLPALIVLSILIFLLTWFVNFLAQVLFNVFLLLPFGVILYGLLIFLSSIIINLALLFAQFFLLVRNLKIFNSISESVRLFLRKPGTVLLVFLSYLIVTFLILIISLLPGVLTLLLALTSLSTLSSKLVLFTVLGIVSVIIFLLGLSFLSVFNAGFFSSVLADLTGGFKKRK